jgi:cyclopropane fatty-acyl-phospholipid synthase-like methyltransferase
MNKTKKLFLKILLWFTIIVADIFIFLFLGLLQMQYDDFYDESKGEYWSWESMNTQEKIFALALDFWVILNIIGLIVGLAYIGRKIYKRIKNKKMKTLEESIATAMDSQDTALVPFLPYILQDFWDLGTPPEIIINLIQKHCASVETGRAPSLHVLDLGCGKGATSIKLAATLKCNCYGIDGIPEFIETSKEKAREYGVDKLCQFEVGDIREKIEALGKFDIIILGAIGQVFGDYFATLTTLSKHLTPEGIIIINDAYIEDSSTFQHPAVLPRRELLRQTGQAGMELIDEYIGGETFSAEYAEQFEKLQKRCQELMKKYPEKTALFESYIQTEAEEYDALENKMICSVMVFKVLS